MAEHKVGSVVVKDAQSYRGIFRERNYSRNVMLKNRHSSDIQVRCISVDPSVLASPENLKHCMQLMTDHIVRYLPVMEQGKIIGLISMTDVIR